MRSWYGVNCSRPCVGYCKDNTTCNHVTGQCNGGCNAGWTEIFCDKGIFFYFNQFYDYYIQKNIYDLIYKFNVYLFTFV